MKRRTPPRRAQSAVAGWTPHDVSMGEYNDFAMSTPGSEEVAAGVCFARGVISGIPPQWLIYIAVENLDQSAERAVELGGAVCGLFQAADPAASQDAS